MLHVLRVEMVINSPWMQSKNWLVQKQTAFGKDTSNLFMADNLPKIVWFSTHHITCMKSWLVQKQTALGQTATGKELSNSFMAGSLPKTILYSFLHKICFHSVSPDFHSSSCGDQTRKQGDKAENKDKGKSPIVTITRFRDLNEEFAECINNSSNEVNAASSLVSTAGLNFTNSTNDVGAEADINNMESIISVSPIPTSKIHKDHPTSQIIGDLSSTTQTMSMARGVRDQGGISQMFNEDFNTCMFACFLSQEEPKRVHQALKDLNLPYGKRAIGTKWVYRNKKDERGIFIRNKARLVAQGHTKEEGIDYEEVFAPVARIKDIRLFLAYASFMGFPVYQMDVKSEFLYGTIEEEVYVCQPPRFKDLEYPDKVYKVVKALYGLH
nr:hypothetical protein [Tanacetum cinerariifolium]